MCWRCLGTRLGNSWHKCQSCCGWLWLMSILLDNSITQLSIPVAPFTVTPKLSMMLSTCNQNKPWAGCKTAPVLQKWLLAWKMLFCDLIHVVYNASFPSWRWPFGNPSALSRMWVWSSCFPQKRALTPWNASQGSSLKGITLPPHPSILTACSYWEQSSHSSHHPLSLLFYSLPSLLTWCWNLVDA